MNFKSTIGLEVHFELKTKSKIFSPSPVTYGAEANTETNVIDWAMPGVLPRLNKDVLSSWYHGCLGNSFTYFACNSF